MAFNLRKTALALTGLAALAMSGCTNIPSIIVYGPGAENEVKKVAKTGSIIIPSSILDNQYVFDKSLEKAKNIPHKKDIVDYMKTPEETEREGGDCEDISLYLCKLLRDQGIESELVFGRYQRKDNPIDMHVWVRVKENNSAYILDSTTGAKLLQSELPRDLFVEYFTIKPEGFSKEDVKKYNRTAKIQTLKYLAGGKK